MKVTYKEFEDMTHFSHPKRQLLEEEMNERQKRCRERTLDMFDTRLMVNALLRKLEEIIHKSRRAGMIVIISPNYGQHYGRKHSNRQYIETKIYVIFTKNGFELRFHREQPENSYYTFKMNDEQREIIYKKLFNKFTKNIRS